MKRKSLRLTVVKATLSLGICLGLLVTVPAFAKGKPVTSFNTLIAKEKNKSVTKRNNNSVKIYLDEPRKRVHVIAKENKGKQIDFFLFDLEGTLIHNHKMKTKDHHRISNLTKGIYVYRVFCGDEETASGQLEIK